MKKLKTKKIKKKFIFAIIFEVASVGGGIFSIIYINDNDMGGGYSLIPVILLLTSIIFMYKILNFIN